MGTFKIALANVLVTLVCIVPGYVLCKAKKAFADHLPTLSGILIYIGTPFLELSSFSALTYDPADLPKMGLFFLISLFCQTAFCLLFFLLAGKRRTEQPVRVVNLAAVMGNVGYFGLPVIRALLPGNAFAQCCATMFIVSMNIVTFTLGIYLLTGDRKYISVRSALVNPATVGLLISLPVYFFGLGAKLPDAVVTMISNFAGMTAPLCMFILGVRLATVRFGSLFTCPGAYLASALKLAVFPLFCYVLTLPLPLHEAFRFTLVILAATPCASHVLNFAEIHHARPDLAANCVLISTLFSFITIPLLTLLPM